MKMSELVPREMHGWKAQDEVETYTRDTIFEYINGAGEVYRLYGFRELVVCRFVKADEPNLVVELFDMGSAEDAFGVFTHGRQAEEAGIGQGSEHRGSFLCFWKNKYFVCIYAEGETQDAQEAVPALGRAVAGAIKATGSKPKILDYLPKEGLIERSVRFFHTHVSLNYHYFVADSNILNLDNDTDAVLAKYHQPEGKSYLLLVSYQNEDQARAACERFVEAYMPDAMQTQICQTEDGTWTAANVERDVVVVVFDAPTRDGAKGLLEAVQSAR
ncbi:MAG: DUF6599 family protein [bacterium]